jgi:hydrogenase maturation protein HypF
MSHEAKTQHTRLRIFLEGSVQGFGFRPTVYCAAQGLRLTGWVRNFDAGLEIEIEGRADQVDRFVLEVEARRPVAAELTKQTVEIVPSQNSLWFEILPDFRGSSSDDLGR